ncbi:nucleotidyltransferase domain-containing protein [Candidatus Saganbacteria bacterium]|uniref:Nucleotidyltransferase domain-containing protein n=1 Tax=Candidatus Saganbacteria bacterium TaxID=2575572 RepID=A0A9D6UKI6_UNCSA|nr:nucleotidyltransferase domain-containing protein [Candidatus Saganbacteria bacterium]
MISFRSKITVKLLDYYFLNPGVRRYINELARLLEIDPKNLDRKLKELEKSGLLQSEIRGKERYFFINRKYPLLNQYRQIFFKTHGIEKKLKEIMAGTAGVKEAYIFGSYAVNKMDSASDLDLLVVGNHSSLDLQRSISALQKATGREINVVNLSPREMFAKRKAKDSFLSNIFKRKVVKLI